LLASPIATLKVATERACPLTFAEWLLTTVPPDQRIQSLDGCTDASGDAPQGSAQICSPSDLGTP
jgi:hypothetical protein